MRWLLLSSTASAVALGAALGGCTFLVTFHDAPAASCDGGDCDGSAGGDAYAPCQGRLGDFCGYDMLSGYAGSPSDLVTCAANAIAGVRSCDAGAGCLSVPGLPDTCDECVTKTPGLYCGREFTAFPPDDSDILVTCADGGIARRVSVCPGVCLAAGGDASCR